MTGGFPVRIAPMLATPGPVPEGPKWIFEMKWDGLRAVTAVAGGKVAAYSRNDKPLSLTYPELDELGDLVAETVVLDGEIVALDPAGRPDFGLLAHRMHRRTPPAELLAATPVFYYVFDVLHRAGRDLTSLPYSDRRHVLDELALGDAPSAAHVIVPPVFRDVAGATVLAAAAEHGLEGVVAKRAGSRYEPGRRSPAWVKTPLRRTLEVVVGGWTSGQGRRTATLGALLLGLPTPAGLRFVGHVGTGFTDTVLGTLRASLDDLARPASPFDPPVPREFARHAHWVAPVMVGEVEYRSFSPDGRLRHPAWRGHRVDRDPTDLPDVALISAVDLRKDRHP